MRVLIATSYLYNREWPEFTKNKTGFGIVLNDIYTSVSEVAETYLTSYVITKGHTEHIPKHTWKQVLMNSKARDWIHGLRASAKYPLGINAKMKLIYYNVNKGYVRNLIYASRPDVIHIHGCGLATVPFKEVADEIGVPYLITLHGTLLADNTASKIDKDLERKWVEESDQNGMLITVVGTGVKKRMEEAYLGHECEKIIVVPNGTSMPAKRVDDYEQQERIYFSIEAFEEKYRQLLSSNSYPSLQECIDYIETKRRSGCKVLIYVGTIYENKNQILLAKTIKRFFYNKNIIVLFPGRECDNGSLRQYIVDHHLESQLIILGFCEDMDILWEKANINVFLSKIDGFGLSIIEGYMRGIPSVISNNLDALPDVYNKNCCVVTRAEEHFVAEAIVQALGMEWDTDAIKRFGIEFSTSHMAEKYIAVYKKATQG